ncbi:MAG TPA: flagellar hook-basal body complex protein FliE [Blastocatellia bacterium]|nr:flagellar hook-basal body complex protein FliE [Blastocatellia bacterium]
MSNLNLIVNGLGSANISQLTNTGNKPAVGDNTFGELLTNAISETNKLQQQSAEQVEKLMTGQVQDVHTALIAVQKADLSFQMMMQVKNKLMDAYNEVMKMSV